MKEIRILGALIDNRKNISVKVQEVLTKYGCNIKTRLGLHDICEEECNMSGLILIELAGKKDEWDQFESELKAIPGVEVKNMTFTKEK